LRLTTLSSNPDLDSSLLTYRQLTGLSTSIRTDGSKGPEI